MENPRPEKVAVVDEVKERFERADAALLTEYRGLNVKALADLRRQLRPAGAEYKVYKNTLVRFAAREAGADGLVELLERPHGHHLRPRRRRGGGQDPAGLRQDQPHAGGQGRPAGHQGAHRGRRRGPGRPAAARGRAGPPGRRPPGPAREAGRPAPGPAPQLRLRAPGPDRRPRRRARRRGGCTRADDVAAADAPAADAPAPTSPRRRGRRRRARVRRAAADEPAAEAPATDEPATDEPATDEPATDEAVTDEPATPSDETDVPTASAEEE